jgi:hypothetical protein
MDTFTTILSVFSASTSASSSPTLDSISTVEGEDMELADYERKGGAMTGSYCVIA